MATACSGFWRRVSKFGVFSRDMLGDGHLSSRRLFATQAGTFGGKEKSKKEERRLERKEMGWDFFGIVSDNKTLTAFNRIGEITKGYFADFHEFRKTGGKRYFARDKLFEEKDSIAFPAISARNLKKKDIVLSEEFSNHVTLVLLWFRAIGQSMCDKYRDPFVQHFSKEPAMQYYEVNVVDSWFLKPLKPFIMQSLTKQKPPRRHENYLCYFGNTTVLKKQLIENIIVGHAYLVDNSGRVRWRAHANPTDEEIGYMLQCSKELLRESQRTNKRDSSRAPDVL